MPAAVELTGLRKVFRVRERGAGFAAALRQLVRPVTREVVAVDCLSFRIDPGERVAFVGPNGAGKSTTIKILSGILHPTAGEVRVVGLIPWRDRHRLAYRIGTVFGQRTQLWYHLPPVDTFDLLERVYDQDPVSHRRRRHELVEAFGIGALLARPVRQLSLGERMRCEIVASLLHAPEILFLDEPTIGLDVTACVLHAPEQRHLLRHVVDSLCTLPGDRRLARGRRGGSLRHRGRGLRRHGGLRGRGPRALAHHCGGRSRSLPDPAPVHPLLHTVASRTWAAGWGDLGSALLFLAWSGTLHPGSLAATLLAVAVSATVFLASGVLIHSAAFWLGRIDTLARQLFEFLITFSLYPRPLFAGPLKWLLFTVVPAGFIGYLPVELVRSFTWTGLAAAVGGAVLYASLALAVFSRGLRRYESGNRFGVRA